jgi:branched-chain amino acid aminotransferase
MIKILSEKNVKNNRIITKEETEMLAADAKIYEVVRVMDGKPVFLKEHFDRMNESIRLSRIKGRLDYEEFKDSIDLLIRENPYRNLNIRISYLYDEKPLTLFYFIESYYPTREEFRRGIHTVTLKMERSNPNAKLYQKELRDEVTRLIKEKNVFEALLVNHDGTISEGSRSNIFFVKGNKLITPPDSSVLLGVTRSKVISLCEDNGIEIEKRIIRLDEIGGFDGAFITGTSNDVLPVKTIDDRVYNSPDNDLVKRVSELYLEEVAKEIR